MNVKKAKSGLRTIKFWKTDLKIIIFLGEKNYIGLCHLLKAVAEPVVRKIFDREIHPDKLEKTLNQGKNKKIIDRLKKKKQINWREYDLLYPRLGK